MTVVDAADVVEYAVERAALLAFDPEAHSYTRRADGVEVPSVTRVIDAAGFRDTRYMLNRTDRGTRVHAYTLQVEAGLLDMDTVPAELRGYVESFAQAFHEYRPGTLLAEQLLYRPALGVAGTVDRLWTIGGVLEVTDFKAGVSQAWHAVQTAGYAYLLEPGRPLRRSTWLLKPSGRPAKRIPHDDDTYDTAAFLNAVGCFHWRSTHVPA